MDFPKPHYHQIPIRGLFKLNHAATQGNIQELNTAIMEVFAIPLHRAIDKGHDKIVADLVRRGALVTPFLFRYATQTSTLDVLRALLSQGFDINKPISLMKPPPLAYALNDPARANWFLENGADPNKRCHVNRTPMSFAVRDAPFAIVTLLYQHGDGSVDRGNLLHYAAERKFPDRCEVMEFILTKPGGDKLVNRIKLAETSACWIDESDTSQGTPLHVAAWMGHLDAVLLLIAHGADPALADMKGRSALDRARAALNTEITSFLQDVTPTKLRMPEVADYDAPVLRLNNDSQEMEVASMHTDDGKASPLGKKGDTNDAQTPEKEDALKFPDYEDLDLLQLPDDTHLDVPNSFGDKNAVDPDYVKIDADINMRAGIE